MNRALMDNASEMFFQLKRAPALVTRSLQTSKITVTEIKCDIVNNGLTAPIPREDAFLIAVQLRDCPRHGLFIDDRQVLSGHLQRARPWGRGFMPRPIERCTSAGFPAPARSQPDVCRPSF